jgi:hypothetical protein
MNMKQLMQKHAGIAICILLIILLAGTPAGSWLAQTKPTKKVEAQVRIDLPPAASGVAETDMLFKPGGVLADLQIRYASRSPLHSAQFKCANDGQLTESTVYYRNAKGSKSETPFIYSQFLSRASQAKTHSPYVAQNVFYPDGIEKVTGQAIDDDNYQESQWFDGGAKKKQMDTHYKWNARWEGDTPKWIILLRKVFDLQGAELFVGGELEKGGSTWQTTDKDGNIRSFEMHNQCLTNEYDSKTGSKQPFRKVEWNEKYTVVWLNDESGLPVVSYTYVMEDRSVVVTKWRDGKPVLDQTFFLDTAHSTFLGKDTKPVYILAGVHPAGLYQHKYLHLLLAPDGKSIRVIVVAKQRDWTMAFMQAYTDSDLPSNHLSNDKNQGLIIEGKTAWTFDSDEKLHDVSVWSDANFLIAQTVFGKAGEKEHGPGLKKFPTIYLHGADPTFMPVLSREQLDALPDVDPALVNEYPKVEKDWFEVSPIPLEPDKEQLPSCFSEFVGQVATMKNTESE